MLHNRTHKLGPIWYPCNFLSPQHVPLRWTLCEMSRDNISPKLVLHDYNTISLYMSGHDAATYRYPISCVCKRYDFVPASWPRFTSLLHDPSVCTVPGGGGLPYKSDGGDRRKFWKEPLKGTKKPKRYCDPPRHFYMGVRPPGVQYTRLSTCRCDMSLQHDPRVRAP